MNGSAREFRPRGPMVVWGDVAKRGAGESPYKTFSGTMGHLMREPATQSEFFMHGLKENIGHLAHGAHKVGDATGAVLKDPQATSLRIKRKRIRAISHAHPENSPIKALDQEACVVSEESKSRGSSQETVVRNSHINQAGSEFRFHQHTDGKDTRNTCLTTLEPRDYNYMSTRSRQDAAIPYIHAGNARNDYPLHHWQPREKENHTGAMKKQVVSDDAPINSSTMPYKTSALSITQQDPAIVFAKQSPPKARSDMESLQFIATKPASEDMHANTANDRAPVSHEPRRYLELQKLSTVQERTSNSAYKPPHTDYQAEQRPTRKSETVKIALGDIAWNTKSPKKAPKGRSQNNLSDKAGVKPPWREYRKASSGLEDNNWRRKSPEKKRRDVRSIWDESRRYSNQNGGDRENLDVDEANRQYIEHLMSLRGKQTSEADLFQQVRTLREKGDMGILMELRDLLENTLRDDTKKSSMTAPIQDSDRMTPSRSVSQHHQQAMEENPGCSFEAIKNDHPQLVHLQPKFQESNLMHLNPMFQTIPRQPTYLPPSALLFEPWQHPSLYPTANHLYPVPSTQPVYIHKDLSSVVAPIIESHHPPLDFLVRSYNPNSQAYRPLHAPYLPLNIVHEAVLEPPQEVSRATLRLPSSTAQQQLESFKDKYPLTGRNPFMESVSQNCAGGKGLPSGKRAADLQQRLEYLLFVKRERKRLGLDVKKDRKEGKEGKEDAEDEVVSLGWKPSSDEMETREAWKAGKVTMKEMATADGRRFGEDLNGHVANRRAIKIQSESEDGVVTMTKGMDLKEFALGLGVKSENVFDGRDF
jgi:hypothetical protein